MTVSLRVGAVLEAVLTDFRTRPNGPVVVVPAETLLSRLPRMTGPIKLRWVQR